MKFQFNFRSTIFFALVVLILAGNPKFIIGQDNALKTEQITKPAVLQKVSASAVLVLTDRADGTFGSVGSGMIVKDTGVILTSYRLVKDANRVQIRLSSGEIFDKVDLIAIDERREVVALKISAANLPAVKLPQNDPLVDSKLFVVNPKDEKWEVAEATLNSVRLPSDLTDSGNGTKSFRFSTWVKSASRGGLLADDSGQVVGIIVASIDPMQNNNFAVPLSSVFGLGDRSDKIMSFQNGTNLELPRIVRPYGAGDILEADPKYILKNARIIYVSGWSELVSSAMMENALRKRPEFEKWNLIIVDSKPELADIMINVEHDLFTFDYRFKVTDRRTTVVLLTGKVTAWDGKTAVEKFSKMIIAEMKKVREPEIKTEKTK